MDNKENLKKHIQELCEILNQNNFKDENGFDWSAGINPKSTFGGGICFDKKAFHFLKKNGYLDKKICWKCGEKPINKEYTFTDGFDSSVNYNICKSCYGTGSKFQKAREGKGSGNCYIATVCYEDINAPEVEILRKYRDEKLGKSIVGKTLIVLYYKFSPSIARKLNNRKRLSMFIKYNVLNPIVKSIKKSNEN